MEIIGIIVVVAIIVSIIKIVGTAKAHSAVSQDPLIKQFLIEPIEHWGKYDGSPEAERKADKAMSSIANNLVMPHASSHTMQLYRTALEKNLYIPLAAVYAYAVGEYVDRGVPLAGTGTLEANQTVFMMRATFPALYNLAASELPPKKSEAALCISANLLDAFLDSNEVRSHLG